MVDSLQDLPEPPVPSRTSVPLGDKVASRLAELIIFGEFPPGKRITELSVEAWSGASRSPIREAFRLLERDGLVDRKANSGVTVTPFALQQLDDVYRARVALEGQMAALAAQRVTPETVRLLEHRLQGMFEVSDTSEPKRYFHASVAFVEAVHEAAATDVLRMAARLMLTHSLRYRFLACQHSQHVFVSSLTDYALLVDAIRAGEAPVAEEIAATLTQRAWTEIRTLLRPAEPTMAEGLVLA